MRRVDLQRICDETIDGMIGDEGGVLSSRSTSADERRVLCGLPPSVRARVASDRPCCICHEAEVVDRTVLTCCGTCYCRACINRWLWHGATCPVCRAPIEGRTLVRCDDRTFAELGGPREARSQPWLRWLAIFGR